MAALPPLADSTTMMPLCESSPSRHPSKYRRQTSRSRRRRCFLLLVCSAAHVSTSKAFQVGNSRVRRHQHPSLLFTTRLPPTPQRRDASRVYSFLSIGVPAASLSPLLGPSGNNNDDDDDGDNIFLTNDNAAGNVLFYLPDGGLNLPPQTQNLIESATMQYIYGNKHDRNKRGQQRHQQLPALSIDDIQTVLRHEYKTWRVPVQIGNLTILEDDEDDANTIASILSLCALHQLPQEITYELLRQAEQPVPSSSSLTLSAVHAFADRGWPAVTFPHGLGVAVVPKLGGPRILRRWELFRSHAHKQLAAQTLVNQAHRTRPPVRKIKARSQFLATMQEELALTSDDAVVESLPSGGGGGGGTGTGSDQLLFFPRGRTLSLSKARRAMRRQGERLQSKGRAGVVAYCAMNFVLYTMGWLWQWRRITTTTTEHLETLSVANVCVRKLSRVFASLFVVSQMLKMPKLLSAVALSPVMEGVLSWTKARLHVSENVASVLWIGSLVSIWATVVALCGMGEYARLRRLVLWEQSAQQVMTPATAALRIVPTVAWAAQCVPA